MTFTFHYNCAASKVPSPVLTNHEQLGLSHKEHLISSPTNKSLRGVAISYYVHLTRNTKQMI